MSRRSPPPFRAWSLVLLCAIGFQALTVAAYIRRTHDVTAIGQEPAAEGASASKPEGAGARQLVVPEHLGVSYGWIFQTQQMLTDGGWRVRHIDYENAPYGRTVNSASPYRWWLGAIAWCDHALSADSWAAAVERAALIADPLLQLVLLAAGAVLLARWFGSTASSLYAIGGVTLFPFAAGFIPATPDDYVLALVCAIAGLLPLLAGMVARTAPAPSVLSGQGPRRVVRLFVASGVIEGVGLWVSPANVVPIIVGVTAGALLAAWIVRRGANAAVPVPAGELPWRAWALGGAVTVLAGYLIEYFPGGMGTFELRAVHPLYAVAWLGCGELAARLSAWIEGSGRSWRLRDTVGVVAGLIGIAALPVTMWRADNPGVLAVELLSFRLTKQPDGIVAPNLVSWLTHDGFTGTAGIVFLVLVIVGVAIALIARRGPASGARVAVGLLLGPVTVALALAYLHLRWWTFVDGLALLLLAAATAAIAEVTKSIASRALWTGAVALIFCAGATRLFPARDASGRPVVTVPEAEGLIERDLGQWLAQRVGAAGAVVLTSPDLTNTLHYYGGLRGMASLAWENKDGLSVALRIMVSNSPEEAHELIRQRGINYIVVPSWDPFFENYVQAASVRTGELFLTSLHRWAQPSWLRPIPYRLPAIGGFEQQSVQVFEVVNQTPVLALTRLTHYFLEMGQAENAKAAGHALRRYPMDFGASVAGAELDVALGDTEGFASSLEALVRRLAAGADRNLAWDVRVSLADVLARGKQVELTRAQVARCLAEADEAKLRSLSPFSLYHLAYLAKALGLPFQDAHLRELVGELLPPEMRRRL